MTRKWITKRLALYIHRVLGLPITGCFDDKVNYVLVFTVLGGNTISIYDNGEFRVTTPGGIIDGHAEDLLRKGLYSK